MMQRVANQVLSDQRIPVDPAGGCCYESAIKPCKSERKLGELLSNTSIICLEVQDTLGKLRIILDRGIILE